MSTQLPSSPLAFTVAQALSALKARAISATELTQAYLDRIETTRHLNAYLDITHDRALADAAASDQRIQEGAPRFLEGIPIAHKDIFCTKGIRTTCSSHLLGNFVPPYESTVSTQWQDAGTVMLGKLNMDEFAMGSSTLTSAYGPTFNPWGAKVNQPDLLPGGSSGGSSSAVASLSAMATTGTDTGGSVRQPASFCGIVGLKPTYGRCSRYGIIAFASSLDQPGPFTRTVEDAALMLQPMAVHDPKESTCVPMPTPDYSATLKGSLKGKRIGIPKEYDLPALDPEIKALWEKSQQWLQEEGALIEEISLPHTPYALPVYYIIAPAEASSNLARYDGVRFGHRVEGATLDDLYEKTRGAGFGAEVQRRIIMGTHVLSSGAYDAYFLKALRVRRLILQDFLTAFQHIDLILTPSTPSPAFSQSNAPTDPMQMYLNDVYTITANLAGLPAISVPAGFTGSGLPLGMQLIAPAFKEAELLNAAWVLEQKAALPNLYSLMAS